MSQATSAFAHGRIWLRRKGQPAKAWSLRGKCLESIIASVVKEYAGDGVIDGDEIGVEYVYAEGQDYVLDVHATDQLVGQVQKAARKA